MLARNLARSAVLLVLIGLVGVGAFTVARSFVAQESAVEAQSQLTLEEHQKQIDEALSKPEFEGELNGFVFKHPANIDYNALARSVSPKCTGANARDVEGEDAVRASRLNFSLGYLPAGYTRTWIGGTACEDDVYVAAAQYADGSGGFIHLLRLAGPPIVGSNVSRDRLEPTTLGGRPAVIVHRAAAVPAMAIAIHVRDGQSVWRLSARNLSLEELKKVAEGIR